MDNDEMIVTHRIIECDENEFIAKGDNNNIEDEKIKIDRIYGVVIFHSQIIGFFILYLLKPLVVIYVMYFIISEIINLKKVTVNIDENEINYKEEEQCIDSEKKE